MISILISLLVFVIVAGLVFWLIGLLPLPAPWGRIVQVICILILLIILIEWFLLPAMHAVR